LGLPPVGCGIDASMREHKTGYEPPQSTRTPADSPTSACASNGVLASRRLSGWSALGRGRFRTLSPPLPSSALRCRDFVRGGVGTIRLAGHFIEKPAGNRRARLAPFSAGQRKRDRQHKAGSRHADVAEPPLLVDRRSFELQRPLVRQNALLH